MAIMKFSTTHLNNLFSGGENGYEWDSVKNLMFDLSDGLDICDEEGNKINKKEAEAKMRNIIFSVLGLDASKNSSMISSMISLSIVISLLVILMSFIQKIKLFWL